MDICIFKSLLLEKARNEELVLEKNTFQAQHSKSAFIPTLHHKIFVFLTWFGDLSTDFCDSSLSSMKDLCVLDNLSNFWSKCDFSALNGTLSLILKFSIKYSINSQLSPICV